MKPPEPWKHYDNLVNSFILQKSQSAKFDKRSALDIVYICMLFVFVVSYENNVLKKYSRH